MRRGDKWVYRPAWMDGAGQKYYPPCPTGDRPWNKIAYIQKQDVDKIKTAHNVLKLWLVTLTYTLGHIMCKKIYIYGL